MHDYRETVEELYSAAATTAAPKLCCTQTPPWKLPGLKVPKAMLERNYGCGTTVHPRNPPARPRGAPPRFRSPAETPRRAARPPPPPTPPHLADDPRLRAECLSGALLLDEYLAAMVRAGFGTIEVRAKRPYRVL